VGSLAGFPRDVLLNLLEYMAASNRNYMSESMHKIQFVCTDTDVQTRSIHLPGHKY
jgi:hypothetical protein